MKKKVCRTIGSVMLLIAVVFCGICIDPSGSNLSLERHRYPLPVRFVCFHNGSTADCSREGLIGPL